MTTPTVTETAPGPTINLTIEFGGGMELLFSNLSSHSVVVPRYYDPSAILPSISTPAPANVPTPSAGTFTDVRFLIWWLREYLLTDKDRPELFSQGETIRPGILILINSTDWELEGELEYELQDGDEMVFISTLHGG